MFLQGLVSSFGILLSIYLLLSSRHLVTFKRWYDPMFLQGLAFFFWGAGHFVLDSSLTINRDYSVLLLFFFYLFLLLSYRFYPLSPHLQYERWKIYIDVVLLTIISGTFLIDNVFNATDSKLDHVYFSVYAGLFVFSCGVPLLNKTNWQQLTNRTNWTLVGSLLFLLNDIFFHFLEHWMNVLLILSTFVLVFLGLKRVRDIEPQGDVREESLYLFERLEFVLSDQMAVAFQFSIVIFCVFAMWLNTLDYAIGAVLFLLLLLARWWFTSRSNKVLMKKVFIMSRDLEKQFTESMQQIRSQNDHLSQLLYLKQSYETLLIKCKEQSMSSIHMENVYTMIEEIVKEWYTTMVNLEFVRVTIETGEGDILFETRQGVKTAAGLEGREQVRLKLEVSESEDDAYATQYVVVVAIKEMLETGHDNTFLHHLCVHVRGLLQRAIQSQQSLDLRVMEQEMKLASHIQVSLIPKEKLVLPYLEAKAVYLPAQYIGGDYVDYMEFDDRYSCFVVADISGHGIPASLLTTGLRSAFRAVIQTSTQPQLILYRINRLLYDDLARTRSYVTMFVAVIDKQRGVMWTSRAGHPAPLYLSDSKSIVLTGKSGVGLGLLPEAIYPQDEIVLEEPFMLVMFTDGLTDLGRAEESAIDSEQWLGMFSTVYNREEEDKMLAMERLVRNIIHEKQQDDDISLLLLHVKMEKSKST